MEDISPSFQICADTEKYTRAKRAQKLAQKIINQTNKSTRESLDDYNHPFAYIDNYSLLTALDASMKSRSKLGITLLLFAGLVDLMFAISLLRC